MNLRTSTIVDVPTRLGCLLDGDLSFQSSARLAHPLYALHPFAARFPYGLPGYFIEALTEPGQTVLDPMCGSGITLLEGWAAGRSVIGVDLDPLARRQATGRTTALSPSSVRQAAKTTLRRAADLLAGLGLHPNPLETVRADMDADTREFLDYWFFPDTQVELACLTLGIKDEPDPDLRNLLEVVFSSTIVTKSGGVSRARDLAHTRPHRVADKVPRRPIQVFSGLIQRAADAYASLDGTPVGNARIIPGDARALPLADATADLIVTSPPYANALDYMRAHKFSLAWLGEPIPSLTKLRGRYIGSEAVGVQASHGPAGPLPASVEAVIERIAEVDAPKSRVLRRYFNDMSASIAEMARVMCPAAAAVIVVGPSTMRGTLVPTHHCLADLATQSGLDIVRVAPRNLDRDRRMMPFRNASSGSDAATTGIENRMHTEYIIGAVKP